MKRLKIAIIFLVFIALLALNLGVLFSTASGGLPAPEFSAGNWIYQNGQKIGCKCPVLYGDCVCEYTLQQ